MQKIIRKSSHLCSSNKDYSTLTSVAMIKHSDQKELGGERAYLTYTSRSYSITEKIRAGTDIETTEEHCLLACSLACFLFMLS